AEVPFTVDPRGKKPRTYKLQPGDLLPVPVLGPVEVAYHSDGNPRGSLLEPCAVCFFMETKLGGVDLQQIGLGGGMVPPLNPELKIPAAVNSASAQGIGRIPVRVLIDDDEKTPETVWKPRLTERLKKASDIFQKYCRMRFEIVEFGSWESDDSITDFNQSLHEFEQKTRPPEGGIVIGFTSQYQRPTGPTKLGGTRAALHPWVLIREWPQHVNEPERLEVLVHELGHYLGATHSPEADSVMRPQLGDRQSRRAKFRIGFDPINTLALNLLADELRVRPITHLSEVSRGTKEQLRAIYHDLAHAMPEDNASQTYLRMLNEYYLIPAQRKPRPAVGEGK
ncbi:MAG: matrixin family metalloprotease, partial [Planctomycetaceae bacterium]|nr:matrixin family metalloprotease [Planctomycetaceae bacterium]